MANVQPGAGYESHIQPSRVITAGSLKLGVTAVVAPEALAKLADPDKGELLPVVKRPDEVLSSILADLENEERLPGADGPGIPRRGQAAGPCLSRF